MPFSLRFLDGVISHDDFISRSASASLRDWFAHNHATRSPVYCLCTDGMGKPLPLSVALRNSYYLRCYKETGHHHHEDCMFFVRVGTPGKSRSIPGVRELEDGSLALTFASDVFPLATSDREVSAPVSVPDAEAAVAAPGGVSRGSIRLQGILRLLLEFAQIHHWRPSFAGKRSASWLIRRLCNASQSIATPAARCSLADLLLWPGSPLSSAHVASHFDSPFAFRSGDQSEALFLAFLNRATPSSTGKTIALFFDWFRTPFFCPLEFWQLLKDQRGPSLQFEGDSPRFPTLVLFSARLRPSKDTSKPSLSLVTSFAPVIFSPDFIPADSGFEVQCASQLVRSGRSFFKPLRCSPKDDLFPDFILSDTQPETYVEVWGRSDPRYLSRKAEKKARYIADGIPLLEWHAADRQPLPDFSFDGRGAAAPHAL